MKILKKISLLFLLTTAFVSCNDDKPDTVGPEVEITNIPDNKEYKFGETIVMNFEFRDKVGMYEYEYKLYAEENTSNGFTTENYVDLQPSFYSTYNKIHTIALPEKSAKATYQEGDYVIKVQASDINQNVSVYYKPIRIVYPETEE